MFDQFSITTKEKKFRAILFRSGGLGDFILTLPLICYLQNNFLEVILVTKPSFFCLVDQDKIKCIDVDLGIQPLKALIFGAEVYSFWKDPEWETELKQMKADKIFQICSRPTKVRHIVESIFNAFNPSAFSSHFISFPWLENKWKKTSTLWIHPGSGSPKKNIPFSYFKNKAEDWLQKDNRNRVSFSFGPADEKLFESFQNTSLKHSENVMQIFPDSIDEFRSLLCRGVSHFLGNDSGPSHLAANLGIPTQVFFRSTNPSIWAPTGPRVKIHQFSL